MTRSTPSKPGAPEPAERSRETVDAALATENESEDRIAHDPETENVSDFVPDA